MAPGKGRTQSNGMGKLKKIQVHMDNMLGHKLYTTAISYA